MVSVCAWTSFESSRKEEVPGSGCWLDSAEFDLLFGLLLSSIDCRLNGSVAKGPRNVAFVPAISNKVDCHMHAVVEYRPSCPNFSMHIYSNKSKSTYMYKRIVQSMHLQLLLSLLESLWFVSSYFFPPSLRKNRFWKNQSLFEIK